VAARHQSITSSVRRNRHRSLECYIRHARIMRICEGSSEPQETMLNVVDSFECGSPWAAPRAQRDNAAGERFGLVMD